MTSILVVEDDADINNMICEYLTERGVKVRQAFSGTEGRLLAGMERFDLFILDLMLPGLSGEELLEELRRQSTMPVIVLSARTALTDKVKVLGVGADDYLTKPFALEELWARIQVQLRHKGLKIQTECLKFGDWELNEENHSLLVKGVPVELTAHEFDIVRLLVSRPKKVFTKQEIYELIWQQDYAVEDKTIHVHISNIRSKLKPSGTDSYIQTVWGIGFKMTAKI